MKLPPKEERVWLVMQTVCVIVGIISLVLAGLLLGLGAHLSAITHVVIAVTFGFLIANAYRQREIDRLLRRLPQQTPGSDTEHWAALACPYCGGLDLGASNDRLTIECCACHQDFAIIFHPVHGLWAQMRDGKVKHMPVGGDTAATMTTKH